MVCLYSQYAALTHSYVNVCSHKYTLFLSTDGNFRLQCKNKRDDPDDVALNNGNGYFVGTEDYADYLKDVDPVSNVSTIRPSALNL